jgi:hypothetical protein
MKFRTPIQVPYKLVPSPAHLLALVPGRRKAIEVRIFFRQYCGNAFLKITRSGVELGRCKHFMPSTWPRPLQN